MSAASLAPHLRVFAPDFARRFALIAAGLAAAVARVFLRDPRLVPLIIPLCTRIARATRRCTALMARLATGRRAAQRSGVDSGRGASPTGPRGQAPRERPPTPRPAIPGTEAWLLHTLRHEAAAYASQLAYLLAEPEAAELLEAAPAAGVILRPVCRLLGITGREAQRSGTDSDRGALVPREPRHAAKRSGTDSDRGALVPRERSLPRRPEPLPERPSSLVLGPPPCPHVRFPWFLRPAAKRA